MAVRMNELTETAKRPIMRQYGGGMKVIKTQAALRVVLVLAVTFGSFAGVSMRLEGSRKEER